MFMRTLRILFAMALTLAAAAYTPAQSTTYDFEAGYQWLDIAGNKDMYRSQLNQEDGLVIHNLSFNLYDPNSTGLADRVRVDASGFGGSPTGRFRLEAGRGALYRLTLNYNHLESFSALPETDNPLLGNAVIPGEHTWNRKRDLVDFELELMPGASITPLIGYRWNRNNGPGRTTYHVGEDEFRLNSDLMQTEKEYFAGAAFAVGTFSGMVTQGWRTYEERDRQSLVAGAGDGNNPGTVLGLPITADSVNSSSRSKTHTPVTNVFISGQVIPEIQVKASYAHSDADGDTTLGETSMGSLASFAVSRFFSSLREDVRSSADSTFWRGDLGLAFDLSRNFTLDVNYQKRSMELDGWALVSDLYLDTMTFGGLSSGDITNLITIRNQSRRTQEIENFKLNVVNLGIFRLWLGGSRTKQDLVLAEDAAEIVVPGSQSGSFARVIKSGTLGASAQIGKGKVILDGESDTADTAILRTDFTDRSRVRFRVQYPFGDLVEVLATAEKITSDNEDAGIGYQGDTKHYAVDLGIKPVNHLAFRLNGDSFKSDSKIPIRRPYDFGIEESVYADDAKTLEGLVELNFDRVAFQGGYSSLKNEGSFAFKLNRTFARLSADLTNHVGAGFEYEKNDYSENIFSAADFRASRYEVFFRIH